MKAKKTRKRRGKKNKTNGDVLIKDCQDKAESETEVEVETVKIEQETLVNNIIPLQEDDVVDVIVEKTQTLLLDSEENQELHDIVTDSDSDQGEWITPRNISNQKLKDSFGEQPVELEVPLVACMTNDYAMQVI